MRSALAQQPRAAARAGHGHDNHATFRSKMRGDARDHRRCIDIRGDDQDLRVGERGIDALERRG